MGSDKTPQLNETTNGETNDKGDADAQPPPMSPTSRRSSPRRINTRVVLKAGSRILVPRADEGGCERATVVGIREGANTLIAHDDMYWAGYKTDMLLAAFRKGEINHLREEDDIDSRQRVMFLITPKAGQPPDSFLVGEVPIDHRDWRVFLELRPAPANGTYDQRYCKARIAHPLTCGMQVKLTGRLAPLKKNEKKESSLTGAHAGMFLGVVDATLPSQHCFWALVQVSDALYIASLFGKDGDAHIHMIEDLTDKVPAEKIAAILSTAQASLRTEHTK